jgi:hypothetical protein
MAYGAVFTTIFFCKIFVTNISGRNLNKPLWWRYNISYAKYSNYRLDCRSSAKNYQIFEIPYIQIFFIEGAMT